MSQAGVIDIESSNPQIPTNFTTDDGSAIPVLNELNLLASYVVAVGIPIETTGSGNTVTIQAQLSSAVAASDVTQNGLSHFNSADFSVDAAGFVSLSGSGMAQTITGNSGGAISPSLGNWNIVGSGGLTSAGAGSTLTFTLDETVAQLFSANTGSAIPSLGTLRIEGGTSLAGTSPVSTTGASNLITTNVQISQALAATDATKIGLCNFDSAAFDVDVNGFVQLNGGGIGVSEFSPNSGTDPVVPNASGNVSLVGTGSITAVGSLNTVTHQLTGLTNHAVQIGAGTATLTQAAVGTNGQVFLGATGADPAFATLTSTGGTIDFTLGANTLNLETSTEVAISYTTDSGSAVPAAGVLSILGGTLLNTSGATSIVTVNADDNVVGSVGTDSGTATPASNSFSIVGTGGITTSGATSVVTIDGTGITGLVWNVVTASTQNITENNGYISNNATSVTYTLPGTAAVGDYTRITGIQGAWIIGVSSGQTIYFGDQNTTITTGTLASTNARDTVEIVCVVANTDWQVLNSLGNITVT